MIDYNKSIEKLDLFIKWLSDETNVPYCLYEIEWTPAGVREVRLFCSVYGHICFSSIEDALKTIDIFENNIDLFFLNRKLTTFKEFKELLFF